MSPRTLPPSSTRTPLGDLARQCGFDLAGVAAADRLPEAETYQSWVTAGFAGAMGYLTDHRAELRNDPRSLLPSARSVICVGKLYSGPEPYSTEWTDPERAWISRYAWGEDYHFVLRRGLKRLMDLLAAEAGPFESRVFVDTAPLLERAYARRAGLGWIGKNTCLIDQQRGSWFFLGEALVSLELLPDAPPPDRCGSCTRCLDACPTQALVVLDGSQGARYVVDSRLCLSYLTIEKHGEIPPEQRADLGQHVFGCDICQDVCPWNRSAAWMSDLALAAGPKSVGPAPPLERLAALTEQEFQALFAHTPVNRARYERFLRNVAVAMGNSGSPRLHEPLERLARSPLPLVAEHARWALAQLSAAGSSRQESA